MLRRVQKWNSLWISPAKVCKMVSSISHSHSIPYLGDWEPAGLPIKVWKHYRKFPLLLVLRLQDWYSLLQGVRTGRQPLNKAGHRGRISTPYSPTWAKYSSAILWAHSLQRGRGRQGLEISAHLTSTFFMIILFWALTVPHRLVEEPVSSLMSKFSNFVRCSKCFAMSVASTNSMMDFLMVRYAALGSTE